MKKKTLLILVCIGIVVAIAIGGYKKLNSAKKLKLQSIKVRTEVAQNGEFIEIVNAPGVIKPKTMVNISAKVSAKIQELPFEEGNTVTAGKLDAKPVVEPSVLVVLDSKDVESQLRNAESSRAAQKASIEVERARIASQKSAIDGQKAMLEQAELDHKRQEALFKSLDISEAAWDQSRCNLDQLRANYQSSIHSLEAQELNITVMEHNLNAAEARVDQAKESLSYCKIMAPIDGTVTLLNSEVGEVVTGSMNNPGTVIMQVADLSEMLLIAEVDESNIGEIAVGQNCDIHVPAFWDEEFKGVVQSIALVNRTSRTGANYYKTEILVQTNPTMLYTGLTADVDIETKKHENVIKVPSQAVLARRVDELPLDMIEDSDVIDMKKSIVPVVYLLEDGKAVVRPVKIGPSDLTHTVVLEGLKEEEKVITGPYKILEGLKHDASVEEEKIASEEDNTEETVTGNEAEDDNE